MFYQGVYDDYINELLFGISKYCRTIFLTRKFLEEKNEYAPTYISSKDSDKNVKQAFT